MPYDARISTLIESQLPNFVLEEGEKFVAFLKAYYEWMEGSCISYTITSGAFSKGEVVVGSLSHARATVKATNASRSYLDVDRATDAGFIIGETITGQTSGAIATVTAFVDMPVRAAQSLREYRDISNTLDGFVEYFRREYLEGIPVSVLADKRLLVKHIRDFYRSKGSEKAIKFLFRILYDEDVEFYYPNVDVLRASDGKWLNKPTLRLATFEDTYRISGYKITGLTSGATATVESLVQYYLGSYLVTEIELSSKTSEFSVGETVRATINGVNVDTTVYGVVSGYTINTRGTGYTIGDNITFTGGGGVEVAASILDVFVSNVQNVSVTSPGVGYRVGQYVTFTGGDGVGANAIVYSLTNAHSLSIGANTYTVGNINKIRVVRTGSGYTQAPNVSHTDDFISSFGILSDQLITISNTGSSYRVGDTVTFPTGTGSGAHAIVSQVTETANNGDNFTLEDGSGSIRLEDGFSQYRLKQETWVANGGVVRIEFSNNGLGYSVSDPPAISITSNTGSGAVLTMTGIQGTGANLSVVTTEMGAIRAIRISQSGVGYTSAPTIDLSGIGDGNASVTAILGTNAKTNPTWLNTDGQISSDKYIQDSRYYQTYSYVIKSGVSINTYRNIVKKFVHPAGFALFGQFSIFLNVQPFGYNLTPDNVSRISVQITKTANNLVQMANSDITAIPYKFFTFQEFADVSVGAWNQSNATAVVATVGLGDGLNFDRRNYKRQLTDRSPSAEIAFAKYVGNTVNLSIVETVPLDSRDYAFAAVELGLTTNNFILRHSNKYTNVREALTLRPDYLYSKFQIGYWTPSWGPQAKSNTEAIISTYANTQLQDFVGFQTTV